MVPAAHATLVSSMVCLDSAREEETVPCTVVRTVDADPCHPRPTAQTTESQLILVHDRAAWVRYAPMHHLFSINEWATLACRSHLGLGACNDS